MKAMLLLLFAASALGCGSGGSGDGDGDGEADGKESPTGQGAQDSSEPSGTTPCGDYPDGEPKTCQAGQYCHDQIFSDCEIGCLSSQNCAADQTCTLAAGDEVGTCLNAPGGAEKDCGAFCEKIFACYPDTSQAECDQACAGLSSACIACVSDANCTDEEACTTECGLD